MTNQNIKRWGMVLSHDCRMIRRYVTSHYLKNLFFLCIKIFFGSLFKMLPYLNDRKKLFDITSYLEMEYRITDKYHCKLDQILVDDSSFAKKMYMSYATFFLIQGRSHQKV